jgi:hypothetical protein
MLTQPDEPHTATGQPTHSKQYERGMGLLFILGSAAALLAVIYLLSLLGD